MVLADIKFLHYSKSYIEYEVNKHNILSKWYSNPNLSSFCLYFVKQWILNTRFNNWIVFTPPPGFAATNNPIESFNFQFKDQFTYFKSRNMLDCAKLICEQLIPVNGETLPIFRYSRESNLKVKNKAKLLNDSLFVKSSQNQNFVYYYGNHSVSEINLELKTWSCRWFLAYATCSHIYKAFQIFDIQASSSKFVIRPRKDPRIDNSKAKAEEILAKDSFMTTNQISMFKTLIECYNKINMYIFLFESIYYSPFKITDIIISSIKESDEQEKPLTKEVQVEICFGRKRGRPKKAKGALKHI
ncbi:unnamed protein product [Brachionus calyciflorus]|uniref:SWIM-type domain-containing protein n=1 Tax=Brachionus calyciflorus TaxID=104777 RepID=A0A814MRE4_9BILA|nr:unnamed protein product [Brachionus calyciflorus]